MSKTLLVLCLAAFMMVLGVEAFALQSGKYTIQAPGGQYLAACKKCGSDRLVRLRKGDPNIDSSLVWTVTSSGSFVEFESYKGLKLMSQSSEVNPFAQREPRSWQNARWIVEQSDNGTWTIEGGRNDPRFLVSGKLFGTLMPIMDSSSRTEWTVTRIEQEEEY